MITKNDVLLLLTELQDRGENVTSYIKMLMSSPDISIDVIKYVNSKRQIDVAAFYDLIRKNYNSRRSSLYRNLVKETHDNPEDILITLSALNLQILLYNKKLDKDKQQMFLVHSRALEIAQVLANYYKTYDLIPCFKLMYLIKSDLKLFENIR